MDARSAPETSLKFVERQNARVYVEDDAPKTVFSHRCFIRLVIDDSKDKDIEVKEDALQNAAVGLFAMSAGD